MNCLQFMAVSVAQRESTALEVQKLLTEYGCSIKTRLGLHDQTDGTCSPHGLLILQLISSEEISKELACKLNAICGVKAQLVDLSD